MKRVLSFVLKLNNTVKTNRFLIYFSIAVMTMCMSLGMNLLINLIDLARFSQGFKENNAMFNSLDDVTLLLLSGLFFPIIEELIFRGVIYWIIKRIWSVPGAIFVSAIAFGLYHGNLVQFIYAFIMGIIFAMAVEWYGGVVTAISMHMCANIFILYILKLSCFDITLLKMVYCILSFFIAFILFTILFWDKFPELAYTRRRKQQ